MGSFRLGDFSVWVFFEGAAAAAAAVVVVVGGGGGVCVGGGLGARRGVE